MPTNENKTAVRRFIEEVVNRKKLDVIDEVFAEDVVHHQATREVRGREALREAEAEYLRAFPDETVTIVDEVAEGDRVAVRWTWRGTHAGEFAGYAPTERLVKTQGIVLIRLADGRIAEMWEYDDQVGFRQQLAEGEPDKG
ncbi:MAG: ester cyclase [Thermoplasmata archaeon]